MRALKRMNGPNLLSVFCNVMYGLNTGSDKSLLNALIETKGNLKQLESQRCNFAKQNLIPNEQS